MNSRALNPYSHLEIDGFITEINELFFLDIGLEGARYTRVAGVPERGAEKKKFLTRSIWLNNNKLTNTKNVDQLAHSVLEYPEELGWIDFSFNYITEIDEVIKNKLTNSVLFMGFLCSVS